MGNFLSVDFIALLLQVIEWFVNRHTSLEFWNRLFEGFHFEICENNMNGVYV